MASEVPRTIGDDKETRRFLDDLARGRRSLETDVAALQAGAITVIRSQIFTASGTYTPHASMVYCIMECLGPGGSGAGGTGSNPGWKVGGGGGSGGYSRTIASRATVGTSQVVTVSAGGTAPAAGNNDGNPGAGDTSIGTLCVAKPGSGGKYAQASTNPIGGAGGVAGTGDIAASGHCGQGGVNASIATCLVFAGQGADTIWGTGALQAQQSGAPSTATGNAGAGYGSGGGGGNATSSANTFAGGNGMPGLAVITEFCSA